MRGSLSRNGTVALATLALLLLASTPAAAKPGDLIVGSASDNGSVLRVNPKSGAVTPISTDIELEAPAGLTFAPNGDLFVADYTADSIFRIPRGSSSATAIASNPPLVQPVYVHYHPDGFLYQPDSLVGTEPIFRIDLNGGVTSFLINDSDLPAPFGVEVAPNGDLYVSDIDDATVVEVDYKTKATRPIAAVTDPYGLGLTSKGRILVADFAEGEIIEVNPRNGNQRTLASNLPSGPYEAAQAPNGKLYVVGDEITEVNLKTGAQDVLVEDLFAEGVEIEPPKCKGKLATIVGSKKNDRLKGSKFPDVIAGLGGKDKIKGLNGKDRLCGGKGKDKLKGGKGKDKLDGGAGRDVERQ